MSNNFGLDADDLRGRVHVIDANHLADFYHRHFVVLDRDLCNELGIEDYTGCMSFNRWASSQASERGAPPFCYDQNRSRWIAQIQWTLDYVRRSGRAQVIWVYGPPGVGKTRLILESLQQAEDAERRVRVAWSFEYGERAVAEGPILHDVIFVVDDCPPEQAKRLATGFIGRFNDTGSALIIISTGDLDRAPTRHDLLYLAVEPLEHEAARELVEWMLGEPTATTDRELVEKVVSITEGYPWFIVLLSDALRDARSWDPHTATLNDRWEAAKRAIAGSPEEYGRNRAEFDRVATIRAKALLAVTLTEDIPWSRLDSDLEERLCQALEVPDWGTLKEAAAQCRERGIIRERLNWRYKYVTPAVLARLVAERLLGEPMVLARRIRRRVPELCPPFYERLERIGVSVSLLRELAANELSDFSSRPSLDALDQLPLSFVARHLPGLTAKALRDAIESTSVEDLRARTDIRRDLVFALEHICRRKEGFEDAEAALFRLAIAENESWSNNATRVWSSLFLVALSLTHRSFDQRFQILVERTSQGPPEFRRVALAGLDRALSEERVGPMFTELDRLDGEWEMPTIGAIREGKLKCWRLLSQLSVDDDPSIAERARKIAVEKLRASVSWGIAEPVLSMLAAVAGKWREEEKTALRHEICELKKHDAELLAQHPEISAALEQMLGVVSPVRFHERLVDVVGRWDMVDDVPDFDERLRRERGIDVSLAREGLTSPERPLLQELDWLESEAAVRAGPFMIHVGMVDDDRALLGPLVERARQGGALLTLPAYLQGLAEAKGPDVVDEILRSWRADLSLTVHTMLTVLRIGPTPERVGWIIEDLRSGVLHPDYAHWLAEGTLGHDADPESLKALIHTLCDSSAPRTRLAALALILDRIEVAPAELPAFQDRIGDLVLALAGQSLPGRFAYLWEKGCELCVQLGDPETAAEACIKALSSEDSSVERHAWSVLSKALMADPEAVWRRIAVRLEAPDDLRWCLVFGFAMHNLLRLVPAEPILTWIGRDGHRALMVAQMCEVHSAPLNDVARQLIIRFGANSGPANALTARSRSTPEPLWGSLAEFYRRQLENAEQWAADPDQNVAEWARQRIREFPMEYERYKAEEEFEARGRHP